MFYLNDTDRILPLKRLSNIRTFQIPATNHSIIIRKILHKEFTEFCWSNLAWKVEPEDQMISSVNEKCYINIPVWESLQTIQQKFTDDEKLFERIELYNTINTHQHYHKLLQIHL